MTTYQIHTIASAPESSEIFPFPISIPERDLTDLRTRLDLTRLPEHETVSDVTQGIELDRLKVLLDAWRLHDGRGLEGRWNAIPHYRTHLDGPEHRVLASPLARAYRNPRWCRRMAGRVLYSSSRRASDRSPIQSRTAVRQKTPFTLFVSALSGFGFSDRARERVWNPGRTARAWAELMSVREAFH